MSTERPMQLPRGERHGRAKLTAAQRAWARWCTLSDTDTARELGVARSTVRRLRDGSTWWRHGARRCVPVLLGCYPLTST